MLKKDIQYKTYNDETVVDTFYFNLSTAELIEMQFGMKGGFADYLKTIIETEDQMLIMSEFKKMLAMSVGRKSANGKQFDKTEEIRNELLQSEAYSVLLLELCTDSNAAAEFVNGVMPQNLDIPAEGNSTEEQPKWLAENREPTQQELQNMTQAEMMQAFQMRAERKKAQITTQVAPDIL